MRTAIVILVVLLVGSSIVMILQKMAIKGLVIITDELSTQLDTANASQPPTDNQ